MDSLIKRLLDFVDTRSSKSAMQAAGVASVLTLMMAYALSLLSLDNYSTLIPFIAFGTPFLFLAIWFFLSILQSKEFQDGYTVHRKKMSGTWIVNYSNPMRVDSRRNPDSPAVGCIISINSEEKLELRFVVKNNRIYEDDDNIVTDVALRREHSNMYNMFYYFSGKREAAFDLKHMAEHVDFLTDAGKVNIEFFAKLSFRVEPNDKKITHMEGNWYDLNGNITKMLLLRSAVDTGASSADALLHFTSMHQLDSALMGSVEFSRG
jgi:hypothetical protein